MSAERPLSFCERHGGVQQPLLWPAFSEARERTHRPMPKAVSVFRLGRRRYLGPLVDSLLTYVRLLILRESITRRIIRMNRIRVPSEA